MGTDQTTKENAASVRGGERVLPGLVISVLAGKPWYQAVPLHPGTPVVIGRGAGSSLVLDDERMSRQNTEVAWDGTRFRIRDLGGRNGTKVDGVRLTAERVSPAPCVLALGQSLALPHARCRGVRCSRAACSARSISSAVRNVQPIWQLVQT